VRIARDGNLIGAGAANADRIRIDLSSFRAINSFLAGHGGLLKLDFAGGGQRLTQDEVSLVQAPGATAAVGFGLHVASDALIRLGARATLLGKPNLTIAARSDAAIATRALPARMAATGGRTRVGAAFALSVVEGTTTARLRDGVVLRSPGALLLSAVSDHAVLTEAQSGARGATAVTPVVAVAVVNTETQATPGSGASLLLSGPVGASAQLTDAVSTTAIGDTTSGGVGSAGTGVGVSLAVSVVKDDALATKAGGGEVHDTGVMLLVLLPVPYVDASAATTFRSKFQRIAVGAAGMRVELAVAAIAFYLWLLGYGAASTAYRPLVTVLIALFIAGHFFIIGIVLAIFAVGATVLVPAWKAVAYLVASPRLRQHRPRAMGVAGALLGVVGVALLGIPVPSHTPAEGVTWLDDQASVRAGGSGFVERLLVAPGQPVTRGTALIALQDPVLATQLRVAAARIAEFEAT